MTWGCVWDAGVDGAGEGGMCPALCPAMSTGHDHHGAAAASVGLQYTEVHLRRCAANVVTGGDGQVCGGGTNGALWGTERWAQGPFNNWAPPKGGGSIPTDLGRLRLLRSFSFAVVICVCCVLCRRRLNQHKARDSPARHHPGGGGGTPPPLDPPPLAKDWTTFSSRPLANKKNCFFSGAFAARWLRPKHLSTARGGGGGGLDPPPTLPLNGPLDALRWSGSSPAKCRWPWNGALCLGSTPHFPSADPRTRRPDFRSIAALLEPRMPWDRTCCVQTDLKLLGALSRTLLEPMGAVVGPFCCRRRPGCCGRVPRGGRVWKEASAPPPPPPKAYIHPAVGCQWVRSSQLRLSDIAQSVPLECWGSPLNTASVSSITAALGGSHDAIGPRKLPKCWKVLGAESTAGQLSMRPQWLWKHFDKDPPGRVCGKT